MPEVFLVMPANNRSNNPIGVFDSGLGGLTVVRELIRQLPDEGIVYFGDTARVPYGTKSKESIVRFSKENVAFLLKQKVKMIVVACNTSSSVALPMLKRLYQVPIVGVIVPGAKKAISVTKNKKIGVIATSATIHSGAYAKNIKAFDSSVKVLSRACPLFVPLAEEGWFHKRVTEDVAQEYLQPMIQSKADTLILGCTHYPLLKAVVQKVMGRKVKLVDSAKEVAAEVKRLLSIMRMERNSGRRSKRVFWVSDEPRHFRKLAKRFLGYAIKNVRRCDPSDVGWKKMRQ